MKNEKYEDYKASFKLRFVAWLLDSVIAFPGYFFYIIPGLIVFGFRDSFTAKQSVGRNVTETKILDVETGVAPPKGRLFARNLFAVLIRSLTFGVYAVAELLVHLGRPDGRCLTDLLFGTVVVSLDKFSEPTQPVELTDIYRGAPNRDA